MRSCSSVLIIDDNYDDILIAKKAISKTQTDCNVESTSNGDDTIKRLQGADLPSMIFLDLKMPGMGGIEILEYIRNHEETRFLPVIMLTASRFEEDMKACYSAGANSYLYKSESIEDFAIMLDMAIRYWTNFNLSPQ